MAGITGIHEELRVDSQRASKKLRLSVLQPEGTKSCQRPSDFQNGSFARIREQVLADILIAVL